MARARWRWWQYVALGLAGMAGLVGIVLLVWRVPSALYTYVSEPKDRAAAEASTRTGLIAGLAGLGALGSLAIATRTYRLTQQGQITDRYTKAIEQLSSDKLDVRLGGIYALERIANDSKRDHPTVVEVLSAFVRERSRRYGGTPPPKQGMAQEAAEKPDATTPATHAERRPATDVQAAFRVLGRLPQQPNVSRGDLSGAQLAGAKLGRADLSGAVLIEANLSGVELREADLSGAWLSGADLEGALLDRANVRQAHQLTQQQLDGARGDAETRLPAGLRVRTTGPPFPLAPHPLTYDRIMPVILCSTGHREVGGVWTSTAG